MSLFRAAQRAFDAFVAALAYFTILPVRAGSAAPSSDTLVMLPLVGALVGAVAGGAACLVASFASHALAVATAFAVSIVLTGAIHVDGFLDSCDGLFASVAPERRLEIMDDPRHGTFAVAGFAVAAALWLAALWSLPLARLPAILAFSGALARWAAVMNSLFLPYGRVGALASAFASKPPVSLLAVEGAALMVFASFLAGYGWGPTCFVLALAASLLGGCFARRRLGGLTGDVYGFLIVAVDVSILIWVPFAH